MKTLERLNELDALFDSLNAKKYHITSKLKELKSIEDLDKILDNLEGINYSKEEIKKVKKRLIKVKELKSIKDLDSILDKLEGINNTKRDLKKIKNNTIKEHKNSITEITKITDNTLNYKIKDLDNKILTIVKEKKFQEYKKDKTINDLRNNVEILKKAQIAQRLETSRLVNKMYEELTEVKKKIESKNGNNNKIIETQDKIEESLTRNQQIKSVIEDRLLEIESIYGKLHKFLEFEKDLPKENLINIISEVDIENKHLRRRLEDIENELSIILKEKKTNEKDSGNQKKRIEEIIFSLNNLKNKPDLTKDIIKINNFIKENTTLINELSNEVLGINKEIYITKNFPEEIKKLKDNLSFFKEKLSEIDRVNRKIDNVNEKTSEIKEVYAYLDDINEKLMRITNLENNLERTNNKMSELIKNKEEFNNLEEFYYRFRDVSKIWEFLKYLDNKIDSNKPQEKVSKIKNISKISNGYNNGSSLKKQIKRSQLKIIINDMIAKGNTRLEIYSILENQGYKEWEVDEALN